MTWRFSSKIMNSVENVILNKVYRLLWNESDRNPNYAFALRKIASGQYFERQNFDITHWKPLVNIICRLNFIFEIREKQYHALVIDTRMKNIHINRFLFGMDPDKYKNRNYRKTGRIQPSKDIVHCACCGKEFVQEYDELVEYPRVGEHPPLRGYYQNITIGCPEKGKTIQEHVNFCSAECEIRGDLRERTNNC
jgi:hypothetical protein